MPLRQLIDRLDVFGLVPSWALFTGTMRMDYVVVLRVIRVDGSKSDWKPVDVYEPPPAGAFLWHPELTAREAVQTVISKMAQAKGLVARRKLQGSPRYRSFLRVLLRKHLSRDAAAFEFVVYAVRRFDPARRHAVVFLSGVHDRSELFHDAV